jgi:hypothetical protein
MIELGAEDREENEDEDEADDTEDDGEEAGSDDASEDIGFEDATADDDVEDRDTELVEDTTIGETQIPEQSAPPDFGSQLSDASSMHVIPSSQGIPAIPPHIVFPADEDEVSSGMPVVSIEISVTRISVPPASTVGCTEPCASTLFPM